MLEAGRGDTETEGTTKKKRSKQEKSVLILSGLLLVYVNLRETGKKRTC